MDPLLIIFIILSVLLLALFLPIKGARSYGYTPPKKRIHEAEAVLSRRLLSPGSEAYQAYYTLHPEHKAADDKSRQTPGLLAPGSRYYQQATFAASAANFQVIDHLGSLVQPSVPGGGRR